MLERHFVIPFVRLMLDVGANVSLNLSATWATSQLPGGRESALLAGAAAAILQAVKAHLEAKLVGSAQDETIQALAALVERYGSLAEAFRAIAAGRATCSLLTADQAAIILEVAACDLEAADSSGDSRAEELIIYVGQWLENWCNAQGINLEELRLSVTRVEESLRAIQATLAEDSKQNAIQHAATQALVTKISPFVSPEEYFRPFMDASRIFRHDWQLVGREQQLDELVRFVTDATPRIAVLPGRGGIGKSKLLHGLVQRLRDVGCARAVFFVRDNTTFQGLTEAELPPNDVVLVLDDAHRFTDLAALLTMLHARCPATRILMITRPHALNYLRGAVASAGYDLTQLQVLPVLKELAKEDVKLLAEQALGERFHHLADRLVEITWDSPLVTVVAGQLVAREMVAPEMLERREDFRDTVLLRFQNELLGHLDASVAPDDCRSLLQVLAAVGPVLPADPRFLNAAATLLSIPEQRVTAASTALEAGGLLVRRGRSVRITPDVLADHVLHHACIVAGQDSGFAKRIFDSFFAFYPVQVLRNLSELDWRVEESEVTSVKILDGIWSHIEMDFATSDYGRQCDLLDVIREIAYLQPQRVLPLVESVIRDTDNTDHSQLQRKFTYRSTALDVRRMLSSVLAQIALRSDYLPVCCDLLWHLGRDDPRQLNPTSDHPLRILQSIATYRHRKGLSTHQVILNAALKWLEAEDAHNHVHSPFDVIDPLLEKSSYSESMTNAMFVARPFLIDKHVVKDLRKTVMGRLMMTIRAGPPQAVPRALKSLEKALRPPTRYFNLQVSGEAEREWDDETIEILDFLIQAAQSTSDEVHKLLIIAAGPWHLLRNQNDKIRCLARRLIAMLDDSLEISLARRLTHGASLDVEEDEDDDADGRYDYEKARQRKATRLNELAVRFRKEYPEAASAVDVLTKLMTRMASAGLETDSWSLFQAIGKAEPEFGLAMAKAIWGDLRSPMFTRTDVLLASYAAVNVDGAMRVLDGLSRESEPVYRRFAAHFLARWSWIGGAQPQAVEMIKRLIQDADESVRNIAVDGLVALRGVDAREAFSLGLAAASSSPSAAVALCELLMDDHEHLHKDVSDGDLAVAVSRLGVIPTIDVHRIAWFLNVSCTRVPESVIDMLISRIARERDVEFQPLPIGGELFDLKKIALSSAYGDLLRRVRDAVLQIDHGAFWVAKLYSWISAFYSHPVAVDVLKEWVTSGDVEKCKAVIDILKEGNRHFVFSHPEFVAEHLDCSFALGEECYSDVYEGLQIIAASGMREGVAGEPFPQDIYIRDRATELSQHFPVGSRTRRWFKDVAAEARGNIAASLLREEEREM